MTDQPTTRDQLIEQAALALVRNADVIAALVNACKCCASSGYEPGGGAPYPSECRWCDHEPDRHGEAAMANLRRPVGHALGGLLADPERVVALDDYRSVIVALKGKEAALEEIQGALGLKLATGEPYSRLAEVIREQSAALLSRLADLTEAAGKERSTEWLRTCATLLPDQWPSAPEYKGPMVPAAERDEALWLHAEQTWWLDQYKHDATVWKRQVDRTEAERDALQERLNDRQVRIDKAMAEIAAWWGTARPGDRVLMAVKSILSDPSLAALQGEQPAEPEMVSSQRIVASPCTGNCDCSCRPEERWATESSVTPPGRIVDHSGGSETGGNQSPEVTGA